MFLGPVRRTVVRIFLQILGYELRLCFRVITKLSGWEDETGMGSWLWKLRVPPSDTWNTGPTAHLACCPVASTKFLPEEEKSSKR